MIMPPSTRLKYRLMTLADGQRLLDVDSDPMVMKFISNGVPTSEHDLDNIVLPRLAKYLQPNKGWGIWEVCDKVSNDYLGWILVRPMHFFSTHPEFDNWELGWRFKQSTWGKGYATESAKHIMQTLSDKHKVYSFSAIAVAENIASIHVMKKIGMSFEKSAFHVDPLINMQMEYFRIEV
ncbi:N-acetyltransferase [Glaciecola sp. 33A]|jgi:RimJ/RimL family protein N-acetyltransferase|nr:N-acetyltransferase [Glaciecola sp. 33A]